MRATPSMGRIAGGLAVVLYAVLVVWGLLSDGTWDDDGPTRFFAVRSALDEPREIIELWNRPLFVLVFCLPYQLGTLAPVFGTSLVTAASGLVSYLAERRRHDDGIALLAIPFLILQPFLFGVSFSALTEPLAVLLIAVAIWAHRTGRVAAFTLAGALLPLARLELSVLLLCWLPFLWRRRRIGMVVVLGVPTLLWSLTGTLFDGDPLWLLGQVFTGEANRYANTPAHHYVERYAYIAGPVVTGFVLLGLVESIRTRTLGFASTVLLAGVALYSVIAWKLSIGHPAGFLRNLVPVAPAATMVAMVGLRSWLRAWGEGTGRRGVILGSIAIGALAALVWSRPLIDHHFLGDERAWAVPVVMLGALGLGPVVAVVGSKARGPVVAGVALLAAAWTLVTEPPVRLTEERRIMKEMAAWYDDNRAPGRTLHCNHIWFFWELGEDPDGAEFARTTQANLGAARPGDLAIVETHYSHRLQGDVDITYFDARRDRWRSLGSANTPDWTFAARIFTRSADGEDDRVTQGDEAG